MVPHAADYWDAVSTTYFTHTHISTHAFHLGPLLPDARSVGLLPECLEGLRALEAGCGGGQNSVVLARHGAVCTAMDASGHMLDRARDLAREAGVEVDFQQARLENWPDDEHPATYDFIHSIYALPFCDRPDDVIRRLARVLRPGGTLLLSVGHPVYAGEWVELEQGEQGLILPDYFHPDADARVSDDKNEIPIHSRYYPISTWVRWIRDAGLGLDQLLEPEPIDVTTLDPEELDTRIPYWSEDWLALYPVLARVPVVLVLSARKPEDHQ